jgi:hypothetical protein
MPIGLCEISGYRHGASQLGLLRDRLRLEKTTSEKNPRPKFFSLKSSPNWDPVDPDTPTLSQREPSLFLDRGCNGFLP